MAVEGMNERAIKILRDNDRGGYTVPTAGLYPYQWNWDSVFVALGFATFDVDRAFQEIETLFEAQWADGMVPHIIFRVDEPSYFPGPSVWQCGNGRWASSGISQPPVAATVVRALARHDATRAYALIDKLDAWHRWWHAARSPGDTGVIAVAHPWESGRDNLPDWDRPGEAIDVSNVGTYTRRDTNHVEADMRPKKADYDRYIALVQFGVARGWDRDRVSTETPFMVGDVGVHAIFTRAERDLAALAAAAGRPLEGMEERISRLERGMEALWNDKVGAYCSLDMRTGARADVATAATFMAPYAGVSAHHDALMTLFDRWASAVNYTVPSYDPNGPAFDHVRYWRGPVWGIVNYTIGKGFAECGEVERAHRIKSDTAALMRKSGFAEYFSAVDGQDCGGGTFSWTAAIWLDWNLGALD